MIDADVRRCWAFKGSTPIVYKNGSKTAVNVGGAYTSTGKFHFYKMPVQKKEHVLENIKALHRIYSRMFLILDKATWNKNNLITSYLQRHNIDYMFFPTGASDLNPVEECWRQTRENVTANTSHNSEQHLFTSLTAYWKKQPFKLNPLNYLSP